MLRDSATKFGALSIINHWLIAALFITLVPMGLYMEGMERGPDKWQLYDLHKSLGVIVLVYGFWRVSWRFIQGFPEHVEGVLAWEKKAAKISHYALLAAIVIMPVSGYIMSEAGGHAIEVFGLFTMPAIPDNESAAFIASGFHGTVGKLTILVFVIHFSAAMKHHFVNKDSTLKRMFGR